MKVPYFDIRSHFLLWMILSNVFSMYINAIDTLAFAVHHVDYRGEKDWWQICLNYTLFLFRFSACFKKKKKWVRESMPQAMEILVYWHIFRKKHGRFQMQVSEHKCI